MWYCFSTVQTPTARAAPSMNSPLLFFTTMPSLRSIRSSGRSRITNTASERATKGKYFTSLSPLVVTYTFYSGSLSPAFSNKRTTWLTSSDLRFLRSSSVKS